MLRRRLFDGFLVVSLVLACAGWFGGAGWLPDVTNLFRPHIAALACVGVGIAALSDRARLLPALAVLVLAVTPLLFGAPAVARSAPSSNFVVLTSNILAGNRDYAAFRSVVQRYQPDLVVLQETDKPWKTVGAELPGLPFASAHDAHTDVFVASRYPIRTELVAMDAAATPRPDTGGGAAIRVEVDRPGGTRPFVVYAIHPPTPRSYDGWTTRNAYLETIAQPIAADAETSDVIVAGDWNTPIWSPFLARFLDTTGLVTTERSAWPAPTRFFRRLARLTALGSPIDRIAVSKDIGVQSISVGPDIGSDHLPVVARLLIP